MYKSDCTHEPPPAQRPGLRAPQLERTGEAAASGLSRVTPRNHRQRCVQHMTASEDRLQHSSPKGKKGDLEGQGCLSQKKRQISSEGII